QLNKTRARRMAGGAVVEMALFLPFLLILLFGVVDFARAIHFDNILVHISREGANLASRSKNTPPQNIITALTQTAEPLDIQRDGMIYITEIVGQPNGMGRIQKQARSAQGNQSLNSRIWTCPAWNGDNTCQIANGQGPLIDLGVPLADQEIVQAVETQYEYDMLINFITNRGPELYALTVL
ncbi:MAG: TadE/TadG family type IV pilus assembly protein, partial [Burkholderiaceae bacterium]